MEKVITIVWVVLYTSTMSIDNKVNDFGVPTTKYVFEQKSDTLSKTFEDGELATKFYMELLKEKEKLDGINSLNGFHWGEYGNSYFPSFPKIEAVTIKINNHQ